MMRSVSLLVALVLFLGSWGSAPAFPALQSSQSSSPSNSEVVSDVATAVRVTLTAPPAAQGHVYGVTARCSAGSATITVTDGGTTIWSSDASFVGTTNKSVSWIPPLTGGRGKNVVITLGSCGAGNTGTLDVQGDIF